MTRPASEKSALPKLTKPQMARLVEIGTQPNDARGDIKPATTEALLAAKCVRFEGGKQWGVGWLVPPRVHLTPLGIRILAGFPGDEFDCFRDALKAPPHG